VIRIAAVADVHFGVDSAGTMRPHLEKLPESADALLLAGDLTKVGLPEEASTLVRELDGLPIPVVAVLGNHDYEAERIDELWQVLSDGGITILDGESTVIETDGGTLGIAGAKGFGGGFAGACATDFGEPEMKAFVRHTRDISHRLERRLRELRTDVRVALLHFSPVPDTLAGERLEIYPFLGSYLLAEAVDRAGCDLVLHGHAHVGTERGVTPGGVHVRNVSQPVIRSAYRVFELEPKGVREPAFAVE
jgi:Icc-related predicted phosphoesterase